MPAAELRRRPWRDGPPEHRALAGHQVWQRRVAAATALVFSTTGRAMGKAKLFIPDTGVGKSCLVLAEYCGALPKIEIAEMMSKDPVPKLQVDGAEVVGASSVLSAIARMAPGAHGLLGTTPTEEAEVQQWLSFRNRELEPLLDDKLAPVNTVLLTRTFVCGSRPTVADFALYGTVATAVSKMTAPQRVNVSNLMRWYDYCQHVFDRAEVFPRVPVARPAFKPPSAAELAAAAAPAAAKGKGKGKGDDKAAAAPADKKAAGDAGGKKAEKQGEGKAAAAPPAAAEGEGKKKEGKKDAKKEKKEKKEKPEKVAASATADVSALDIRVGTIRAVKQHPNADALYVEEIDLGEDKPRQVISGLVKFVPLDKMQGRRVCVVCNLKPAKMRDVMSYGLVLCASNKEHTQVDPIAPPEGAANGERVTVEGFDGEPMPEINEPKKKIFATVSDEFITTKDGVPTYRGKPFRTAAGTCASSIPDALVK
ncbi:unnamed protein product [Pedinophyceae sp. YPF-701]|nr:unnamed protein product [Pedinophyceae sp. YPF-701]